MNLVGEKGQKLRTRLGISGSQLIVSWVPATRLHSQVLILFTSHLWGNKRRKSFWAESSVVKGPGESHGTRWNKSHDFYLCSIFSLAFLLWEQVHGDSQRHWWCPWHLMFLVITSLLTHPWVQSIFSLVISPGSPFSGRLTWLIAANSQVKHGMRSWWLTCWPSSKHGRNTGNGRVAIY